METRSAAKAALFVSALGVVYGDIGTSPIYTIKTVFSLDEPHPVPVARDNVFGVISLIVWSVTLVVTIKYVLLVLRADNNGEGGTMALITLLRRRGIPGGRATKAGLAALGVFGAALFFGDSMITPAISVLSAVEGVKVVEPSFDDWVVPVTVAILVTLFACQRFGTAKVGRLFGPIMMLWFTAIGTAGAYGIRHEPEVLYALSPHYAVAFLVGHFHIAFFALAAVVLAVTGAEALYADMGHFGRQPIARAWLWVVFPACILSYLGQGALVLNDPAALENPFFLLVPEWARIPLVVLATAATVIASQAVITGAFSLTNQAVALGYLPRLRIVHTSDHSIGQVYVPWVNWTLMVSVVVLVVTFGSSAALAYAFGMAVTATVTITAILFLYLARRLWNPPLWLVIGGGAILLSVDLLFLAANMTKLLHGAWLPLAIGLAMFTVMTTWRRGRSLVSAHRRSKEGPLLAFIEEIHTGHRPVRRIPGTAVFLNRSKAHTPLALRANVEHNRVLHESTVILAVETDTIPYVADADRIVVDRLGRVDGIFHVTATMGYAETADIPAILKLVAAAAPEGPMDLRNPSYFLSTIDVAMGPAKDMARWRQRLFLATSRVTADAADSFGLPRDRTVVIGSRVEI